MNWIMDNWFIIVASLAGLSCIVVGVFWFFRQPSKIQQSKVKEWLLWAVTKAETELGGGTGQLKLAMVYDLFIARFPTIAKFMTFEMYSKLVDQALQKMNELLVTNKRIKELVEGCAVPKQPDEF